VLPEVGQCGYVLALQSTLASVKSGLPDLAPRNFNFDEKLAKQQWLFREIKSP
jgi:hypothetical protein